MHRPRLTNANLGVALWQSSAILYMNLARSMMVWATVSCLPRCLPPQRRELLAILDAAAASTYVYDRRNRCELAPDAFAAVPPLTYHDNVANCLARRFYTSHGARVAQGQ